MIDDWEGVNAALARFGLPARPEDRDTIVAALDEQVKLEADEEGDQFLMRLLCVQLFSLGQVEDSLRVWRAKSCNFDTHCGIDVQFVCGAGLEPTKAYLRHVGGDDALDALDYLVKCEAGGDFAGFSPERVIDAERAVYKFDAPAGTPDRGGPAPSQGS
jgi:hypothetical protein